MRHKRGIELETVFSSKLLQIPKKKLNDHMITSMLFWVNDLIASRLFSNQIPPSDYVAHFNVNKLCLLFTTAFAVRFFLFDDRLVGF